MDTKLEGIWAVVVAGTHRYFGQLAVDKQDALHYVQENEPLKMNPAMELPIPAQLTPRGFVRLPVMTPIDLAFNAMPIYLTQVSAIYFLDDIAPQDKRTLLKLYSDVTASMKEQAQQAAAQDSGIVLPRG